MAPRKDFTAYSKKDEYNYSRQSNVDYQNLTPPPPVPSNLPWELNNILGDLSDSYVYLLTALSKMSQCARHSKVIDKAQKKKILELYKAAKKSSEVIKKVGMMVEDISSISGQPTKEFTQNIPDTTFTRKG
jgi:hypothetical protein